MRSQYGGAGAGSARPGPATAGRARYRRRPCLCPPVSAGALTPRDADAPLGVSSLKLTAEAATPACLKLRAQGPAPGMSSVLCLMALCTVAEHAWQGGEGVLSLQEGVFSTGLATTAATTAGSWWPGEWEWGSHSTGSEGTARATPRRHHGIRTLAKGEAWPVWPESMDSDVFDAVFPHDTWATAGFDVDAYVSFTAHLRTAVRSSGLSPVYVVESPRYFVEHLLPLFVSTI